MAVTGLAKGAVTTGYSYPVVALYAQNGGTVTYSSGMDLARGVSIEPNIETANDDNTFYANNAAAEEGQRRFRRGDLTLTVDGLLRTAENLILGISGTRNVTVQSGTVVAMTDYGDSQNIPYCGFGCVVRRQSAGVVFYQAHIYPKVRFASFAPGAATEEDQIDWQTQELNATLMRDDTTAHNWQSISEPLATELEAYNAVRVSLGLTAAAALPGNA